MPQSRRHSGWVQRCPDSFESGPFFFFFADTEPTGSAGGRPEPRARRRMGGRTGNGVAAGLRDYGKRRQPRYCLIRRWSCMCVRARGRVRWSCKFNLLFLDFTQCCPETVSLSFSFYECLIISFTTLQVSRTKSKSLVLYFVLPLTSVISFIVFVWFYCSVDFTMTGNRPIDSIKLNKCEFLAAKLPFILFSPHLLSWKAWETDFEGCFFFNFTYHSIRGSFAVSHNTHFMVSIQPTLLFVFICSNKVKYMYMVGVGRFHHCRVSDHLFQDESYCTNLMVHH